MAVGGGAQTASRYFSADGDAVWLGPTALINLKHSRTLCMGVGKDVHIMASTLQL